MTLTHLTLTGPQAGSPLCDIDKMAATERGERFAHAAYINPELPQICSRCKAEYDAALADTPLDPILEALFR